MASSQAIDLGLLADRRGVDDIDRDEPTDSEPAEAGPAERAREKSRSDAPAGDHLPILQRREQVAAWAKGRGAGNPRYENCLGSESPRREDMPRNRSGGSDHTAEFTTTAHVSSVDSLWAMLADIAEHWPSRTSGTPMPIAAVPYTVMHQRILRFVVSVLVAVGCAGCFTGKASKSKTSPPKPPTPRSLDREVVRSASSLGLSTAVPRSVVADCETLAVRAYRRGSSRPVYCLPLVPKAGWTRIEAAGGLNGYRNVAEAIVVSVRSARTPPPIGRVVPTAHWTFAEGEPNAVIGQYLPPDSGRRVTHTRLDGRPVTVYAMPKGFGLYSGHVVIEWRQRTVAFQVSMHGYGNLGRVALMARALMRQVARCMHPSGRIDVPVCQLVF